MANPLKELDLKINGFQFIQEIPIAAPPAKVWSALLNVGGWFQFDASNKNKITLEAWIGGRWIAEFPDNVVSLMGIVTHIEPEKLLRISGQIGLTHLPVTNVVIFELQPKSDNKSTLLRLGNRTFGFMDDDVQKRQAGGWSHLLPQLKSLAEQP